MSLRTIEIRFELADDTGSLSQDLVDILQDTLERLDEDEIAAYLLQQLPVNDRKYLVIEVLNY